MTTKVQSSPTRAKQIRRTNLAGPQLLFELRVLNAAFLRIAAALPRRPEPRHAWDNRARASGRVPHPNHDAVQLCRRAMHDAIETDDDETVRRTRLAIEDYFQRCADAAIDVGVVMVDGVRLTDVVSDSCRAIDTMVAADANPSPGAMDQARDCAQRATDRLSGFLRTLGTKQRTTSRLGIL